MDKKEQGFTIVELIVGMAILTLIMSGTYAIFASSLSAYRHDSAQEQHIQDSRYVLTEITSRIKNATAITSPGIPVSPATTLTSTTLSYSIGATSYTIALNGSTVELKVNGVLNQSWVTGHAQALTFTRIIDASSNKAEVIIQLTLTGSYPQSTTVRTLNDIP